MIKNLAALANRTLKRGQPVLAAVSGGADSLAMMQFLLDEGYELIVASFDHQLRGESGEADVAAVEKLCAKKGIRCVSGKADVMRYATTNKLSIEEAARNLRYTFLFEKALQFKAQAVVTGHTADDQAETVLMHFIRGSGLAGLKGIEVVSYLDVFEKTIPLIRPILEWTRQDTEEYCRSHELEPCQDATNSDTHFLRNRLRHEVLPILKQLNPNIVETLNRSSLVLQGEHKLLSDLTQQHFEAALVSRSPTHFEFDLAKVAKLEKPLFQRIIRQAAFALKPGLRDVDKEAMDRISLEKGIQIGGGLLTFLEEGSFFITTDIKVIPAEKYPQCEDQQELFTGIQLLNKSWTLEMSEKEVVTRIDQQDETRIDNCVIRLDAGSITAPLILRHPISGDRFEPLGMPKQTMKLTDLFINLKIPKRYRENYPILTHNGKIIWILGLRRAEALKIDQASKEMITLKLKNKTSEE